MRTLYWRRKIELRFIPCLKWYVKFSVIKTCNHISANIIQRLFIVFLLCFIFITVIADNHDISITSSTSEIEANNNNDSSTNYKRWHSGSQKSSGTISKLPNSKRSLRYSKKPKEQVMN